MTDPIPFAPSFERKLDRAHEHTRALDGQVTRWLERNRHAFVRKLDPDTGETVVTYQGMTEPPDLAPIVGDALQNLRSALDHLAFALSVAYSGHVSDDAAESIAFPIRQKAPPEGQEDGSLVNNIRLIDPAAQTVIKELQPYLLGPDLYHTHPLWALNELARIDRHRFLHTVGAPVQHGTGLGGDNLYVVSMSIFPVRSPGAVVARYLVKPIDPTRPMHMDLDFTAEIQFNDGPRKGESATRVVADLESYVVNEVAARLVPFLLEDG